MANIVNGWQMNIDSIGVYGNSYMKRAIIAMLGLGSNAAEDAVYPILLADADGNAVRWRQRLHHALRRRQTAARPFVLVGNHVRLGRLPGRQ